MGAGDFWVGPRREGLGACAASGWVDSPDCVPSCVIPVFAQGLGRRFGAISGLNRQSGIRNVSGRNNARYAITLSYAFLSFLLELSYFRGRDGRRSRKPGARACRCGQSNGSWASTGPPSGVIWRPEVLQDGSSGWCPIRRHRIPWQRNGVTFSLNTYPDIFPDLRPLWRSKAVPRG